MTTRLNLLPWREIRRKEQDRQLLSIAAGAWILMGLMVFYAHLHVSGLVDEQAKRNEFLTKEIAKVEEEIKEIKEVKAQRDALLARMRVIQQLQSDRSHMVHVFDDLVRKLPEGMYLTNIKQQGKNFTIQGTAQSNARVSAFMRNLDGSEWFAKPELDVINVKAKGTERVSEFTLRVQQKQLEPEKLDKPAASTAAGTPKP